MSVSQDLIDGRGQTKVRQALANCETAKITEWAAIKGNVRDALSKFVYEKLTVVP